MRVLAVSWLVLFAACGDDGRRGDTTETDLGSGIRCEVIPCGDLDPTDCGRVGGCRFAGVCEGSPVACAGLGSLQCMEQGCFWDSTTSSCSGTPSPCETTTEDPECFRRDGCDWRPFCNGSPLTVETETCEGLTDSTTCAAYSQCRVAE